MCMQKTWSCFFLLLFFISLFIYLFILGGYSLNFKLDGIQTSNVFLISLQEGVQLHLSCK